MSYRSWNSVQRCSRPRASLIFAAISYNHHLFISRVITTSLVIVIVSLPGPIPLIIQFMVMAPRNEDSVRKFRTLMPSRFLAKGHSGPGRKAVLAQSAATYGYYLSYLAWAKQDASAVKSQVRHVRRESARMQENHKRIL